MVENKKIIILFVLVLSSMLLLTGCLDEIGEEADNSVWNDYSSQTFAVKYPAEWMLLESAPSEFESLVENSEGLESIDGVMIMESDSQTSPGFVVIDMGTTYPITDTEFDQFKLIFSDMQTSGTSVSIVEEGNVLVDGQSGYKYVMEDSELKTKTTMVVAYKETHFYIIIYGAAQDVYNDKLSLFEEMVSSFKIY